MGASLLQSFNSDDVTLQECKRQCPKKSDYGFMVAVCISGWLVCTMYVALAVGHDQPLINGMSQGHAASHHTEDDMGAAKYECQCVINNVSETVMTCFYKSQINPEHNMRE